MYGIYGEIIRAAENALKELAEAEELIEYPEVQADKAYYLSVLNKYNFMNSVKQRADSLKAAIAEENELYNYLSLVENDEKPAVYTKISALRENINKLSDELSALLGCTAPDEDAVCRIKADGAISGKLAQELFALLKADLTARSAAVSGVKEIYGKGGYLAEISFLISGKDGFKRVLPLAGSHRVLTGFKHGETLSLTAILKSRPFTPPDDNELKVDVFHSSGAGGQNINKVETAIRITHIPTGLTVCCQDERSQLKNKQRALDTLKEKLEEKYLSEEKARTEEYASKQLKKVSSILFDGVGETFKDTRLPTLGKLPFPPQKQDFSSYINSLIALGK